MESKEIETQRESGTPKERGRQKQFYIKPSVESKAVEFCKKKSISFSLLVKIAIEHYIEEQEG